MKRFLTMLVIASFVMVPATVVAQDDQEETVYDFEGEDLEGGILSPHGEDISGDDRGRTSSLIDIREDFIPEMLESVESL